MRRRDRIANWLRLFAAVIDGTAMRWMLTPTAIISPLVLTDAERKKLKDEFEKPYSRRWGKAA